MADEQTTTINAEIPRALHGRVRIQAIQEHRSVKELVRLALEQYLERAEAKPKSKAKASA